MLRRLIPNRFASSATASLASLPRMATARATAASSSSLDTLLTGTNAQWLDSMFEDWAREPASVSPAFAAFFKQVAAGGAAPMGSTATSSAATASSSAAGGGDAPVCKGKRWLSAFQNSTTREAQKALSMILEFETSGHTRANLDPLGHADKEPHRSPLSKRKIGLAPDHLGLSDADLNMLVPVGFCDNLGGIFQATTPTMSMRDLHAYLSKVYTGNIGWEFMHINNFEVCKWLRNRIEVQQPEPVDNKAILSDLADAGAFETFLHRKYNVTKRFGIEGGESLIPGLRALINRSVDRHGAKKFVLGMAHRGRLNVLTNVCGKPVRAIFKEFDSITPEELPDDGRQGDVKYHLGWRSEGLKSRERGLPYRMQLMFNPSHLEAVNPIVQGFTRCLQAARAPRCTGWATARSPGSGASSRS